jgi:hypothetical protein
MHWLAVDLTIVTHILLVSLPLILPGSNLFKIAWKKHLFQQQLEQTSPSAL